MGCPALSEKAAMLAATHGRLWRCAQGKNGRRTQCIDPGVA
ncbi:hypothetical protein HMPREF9946_03963 [Acetobacteraceae bacterium AT-5844]|nr:hypothetical protein HMPREF9946_03963 [Acetobacteraceae bacterium AT-5844]